MDDTKVKAEPRSPAPSAPSPTCSSNGEWTGSGKFKSPIFRFYTWNDSQANNNDASLVAACKICAETIRGSQRVTSNFVSHIKRRHTDAYEQHVLTKRIAQNKRTNLHASPRMPMPTTTPIPIAPMPASTVAQPAQGARQAASANPRNALGGQPLRFMSALNSWSGVNPLTQANPANMAPSFGFPDPDQRKITAAVAQLVFFGLHPFEFVEGQGFQQLVRFMRPTYRLITAEELRTEVLPTYIQQTNVNVEAALASAREVNISVDVWASEWKPAYAFIYAYWITDDFTFRYAMLQCHHIYEPIDPFKLATLAEATVAKFCVKNKARHFLMDDSSETTRALRPISLPAWPGVASRKRPRAFASDGPPTEETAAHSSSTASKRVLCFARALHMCVRDCLAPAQIRPLVSKISSIVDCLLNSKVAGETMEDLFYEVGSETWWHAQLRVVRRAFEFDVKGVVKDQAQLLNETEEATLRELLQLLAPFEETAILLQKSSYEPISLVAPCVLGLRKHLGALRLKFLADMAACLSRSLERRLGATLNDPLFICSTILDPRFKLTWCFSETDQARYHQMLMQMLAEETNGQPRDPRQPSTSAGGFHPSKLLSFLPVKLAHADKLRLQVRAYLNEELVDQTANPLDYWRERAKDFPDLGRMARRLLAIPATPPSIVRVFVTDGGASCANFQDSPETLDLFLFVRENRFFLDNFQY